MPQRRLENLALVFQEAFTATVRLRAGRQTVSDPEMFRHHIREALKRAAGEAQQAGYEAGDVKLATFALVAFLDESILNSRNPLFADWPRRPLQEELFGMHVAGEKFFVYLEQLLTRSDSPDLADLLEVYYLCLLLGYGGRYSNSGAKAELRAVMDTTGAKIRRIRGGYQSLAPEWALPSEGLPTGGPDPLVRKLTIAAIATLAVALVLFVIFKLTLSSGISSLQAIG